MSTISAPADRRFRRAHLKPSRKRGRWHSIGKPLALYGVLAVLLVFAAYRASMVVAGAHVLQVDRIAVLGNQRLSKADVLALLNGLRGENIVSTDLDRWRRRLLAAPWVRDASLRRSLPSTIDVVVWEREPVGIGRIGGDTYLVDERGVIIDQYGPQYADLDLPIIDGLGAAPHDTATLVDEARADLAARVIAAVKSKPRLSARLSQVDVSDLHNAAVLLTGDPTVIQLGEDQFAQRLQGYVELAPALHARVADIDYVDLRFGDRIYVRPTKVEKKKR
ncbi:MAG TPA: FtsQ-type POTRA domain-containing protein [Vicinamibacterales bacterium]|nr:FtsQ-type POTRA domain-containing protein [Vicinamibacterales bacterium]